MNKLLFISIAYIFIFGLSACDEKTIETPESGTINQSTSDAGTKDQKRSEINSLKPLNSTEKNGYQSIPEKNMN